MAPIVVLNSNLPDVQTSQTRSKIASASDEAMKGNKSSVLLWLYICLSPLALYYAMVVTSFLKFHTVLISELFAGVMCIGICAKA